MTYKRDVMDGWGSRKVRWPYQAVTDCARVAGASRYVDGVGSSSTHSQQGS